MYPYGICGALSLVGLRIYIFLGYIYIYISQDPKKLALRTKSTGTTNGYLETMDGSCMASGDHDMIIVVLLRLPVPSSPCKLTATAFALSASGQS